jgi:hypothetical protein
VDVDSHCQVRMGSCFRSSSSGNSGAVVVEHIHVAIPIFETPLMLSD